MLPAGAVAPTSRCGHIQPQKSEQHLFDDRGFFAGYIPRYPGRAFRFPVFLPLIPNVKLLLQIIRGIYATIGRVGSDRHRNKSDKLVATNTRHDFTFMLLT